MSSCSAPMPAWRTTSGITLRHDARAGAFMLLGCGRCRVCLENNAKDWALRGLLENQQHDAAIFATFTYDDKYLPPTLSKRDFSLGIKRIRSRSAHPIRFLGCGEYGSQTARPHYHAILYGLSESAAGMVESAWRLGHVRTTNATPATIAYTAQYTAKKILHAFYEPKGLERRRVSDDGEEYTYQPAFRQSSNRPGIGAWARHKPEYGPLTPDDFVRHRTIVHSWRSFAVRDGHKQRVPRYLHEAWKAHATPEEIQTLISEREALTLRRDITELRLLAEEKIAEALHQLREARRTL